jgi:hypothetical protein
MNLHRTMPRSEAADRLAIRELVQAYAHCADRRDAMAQMALCTADTHLTQEFHERESLAPVFAALSFPFPPGVVADRNRRRHGRRR